MFTFELLINIIIFVIVIFALNTSFIVGSRIFSFFKNQSPPTIDQPERAEKETPNIQDLGSESEFPTYRDFKIYLALKKDSEANGIEFPSLMEWWKRSKKVDSTYKTYENDKGN